jgi:hypothetical protein
MSTLTYIQMHPKMKEIKRWRTIFLVAKVGLKRIISLFDCKVWNVFNVINIKRILIIVI